MSDPQTLHPKLSMVPALIASSLLGGLIALGLSSLWRHAIPGPMNPPAATVPAVALPPSGPVEFVEFLPPLTPEEKRIEGALEKPVDCEFVDQPLTDVVLWLAEAASIPIVIDSNGLAEEGISSNTSVTLTISGLRLRSLLNLILDQVHLTAIPRHDVLLVTTSQNAHEQLASRTYPVADLCRVPGSDSLDFESLKWLIEIGTSGPWASFQGTMTELPSSGSLTVGQTYRVHREVLDLLRSLRVAQRCNLSSAGQEGLNDLDDKRSAAVATLRQRQVVPSEFIEAIGETENDAMRHIEKALDKMVTIDFENTPLTEVVSFFVKQLSINVVIDDKSLKEENIPTDIPVTLRLQDTTARAALELLLRPLKLAAVVEHEVLFVTTAQTERKQFVTQTYPVFDLIGPNGDYAALIKVIESATFSSRFEDYRGTITESPATASIVIRQSLIVHRQVLQLLRQQREAQQHMTPNKPINPLPTRR